MTEIGAKEISSMADASLRTSGLISLKLATAEMRRLSKEEVAMAQGLLTSLVASIIKLNDELSFLRDNARKQWEMDSHRILSYVEDISGFEAHEICGPSRQADLVETRSAIATALHKTGRATLVNIGTLLGGRHHTTIINLIDRAEKKPSKRVSILISHIFQWLCEESPWKEVEA